MSQDDILGALDTSQFPNYEQDQGKVMKNDEHWCWREAGNVIVIIMRACRNVPSFYVFHPTNLWRARQTKGDTHDDGWCSLWFLPVFT